jgi:hypothetical protein
MSSQLKLNLGDPDATVANHGTIYVLTPITRAAQIWVDSHIDKDAMRWGPKGIVVEHRYIDDILVGMNEEGLTVSVTL